MHRKKVLAGICLIGLSITLMVVIAAGVQRCVELADSGSAMGLTRSYCLNIHNIINAPETQVAIAGIAIGPLLLVFGLKSVSLISLRKS